MKITFPHKPGKGGPGSFQIRFEKALEARGYTISYANDPKSKPDLVFVVGGTKKLAWLRTMKKNNVPIVYRLDGINWLHWQVKTNLKKILLAEYRNLNFKLIHAFFADFIIYQSEFVQQWWGQKGLRKPMDFQCINNGVDLNEFNNLNQSEESKNRLVILEGTIDYTPYAVELLNELAVTLPQNITMDAYGRFENGIPKLNERIIYHGLVNRNEVAQVLKSSIYLSLDINAACPNTVAESLACGSPVVGFDTGSLKELVQEDSGIIVDYGGNPWKVEKPDYKGLADAIVKVSENYKYYSANARSIAEKRYDINIIVDRYMAVIQNEIEKRKR